jgi:radical SAM protein with 4Fe4S-binding SPASM domain
MQMRANPLDIDVPFFPFRIWASEDDSHYFTANHLVGRPICLNRQAAEVLRMADGETPFADIVSKLVDRYPDAGGRGVVSSQVVDLLRYLATYELIWWREVPLELVPVGPPPIVFWEITAACNLRCLHCVVGAGTKLDGELSTERCLELAQELAEAGVQNVTFSGGEPLIHPDFRLLAERVHELGLMVQVSTNGTLVTPEIARWLRRIGAEIQVSLDGSTPEIHDHMRPGRGAFDKTIAGIEALVAAGHDITIGTVVSTMNLGDIPSIVELAEGLGAARFRLVPFVPKGRGYDHMDIEISPFEMKQVTQYLHDLRGKTKIRIASLEFEDMLNDKLCQDPLNLNRGLGCSGAVAYATITPTGEVLPCHFFEGTRADSVAFAAFSEVWHHSRFLNYFRHLTVNDLHGACRDCSWLMRCGGSCRAVNFAKGDLLGGNHHCWIAYESRTNKAR